MGFPLLKDLVNKDLLNVFLQKCIARFADKETVSAISESLNSHIASANEVQPYIRVKSCTEGSTKIFRLTIDDEGIISGEEEISEEQIAAEILQDFTYVKDTATGNYVLTGWKGTYNGEPSTEIIIPDTDQIQIEI